MAKRGRKIGSHGAAWHKVFADAETILKRLAKQKETVLGLAVEYGVCWQIFRNAVVTAAGKPRWSGIVRRGPRPGEDLDWLTQCQMRNQTEVCEGGRPSAEPKDTCPAEQGPRCFWCQMIIKSDTRLCGNCGTLQQG